MNLAARGAARQREKIVVRFGCFLVTLAVLASLVFYPPKAKAFAMTSSAVTALAGGFLNACGLAPVVSGMSSGSDVNESLARLLQDFLNEEVGGISVADWALSFGEIGLAVKDKKIIIPKPFAEKLNQFAQWVASKYGTKAGVNQVYGPVGAHLLLADGSEFFLSTLDSNDQLIFPGTIISTVNSPVVFSTGASITFEITGQPNEGYGFRFYRPDGSYVSGAYSFISDTSFCLCIFRSGKLGYFYKLSKTSSWELGTGFAISIPDFLNGEVLVGDESLSLDVSDTMQEVLDRLTVLEEGQSIALDVGATQSMEIQDILQGILDAILAGNLAASAEVVDEAVEPVEPDPPVVPVVPEGLDKLGAALTSRFPFSIPWDVYKGVTLLAAPPKAPYFEVDFMAPIAHRVGGWKGSTKIVLDFSEYEIIGQVCRWTSMIGFCLMLAAGTKRLIWTA